MAGSVAQKECGSNNRMLLLGFQGQNPVPEQGCAFLMNDGAADLGHADVGCRGVDAGQEEGCVRVAGDDSEVSASGGIAGSGGAFHDASVVGVVLAVGQVESSVAGEADGVVAVGAVDVQIASGAVGEGAVAGIVPAGKARGVFRRRGVGEEPGAGPVIELVHGSGGIVVRAIELAGVGSQRPGDASGASVTRLALVHVGHQVVGFHGRAIGGDPGERYGGSGDFEDRIGLGLVPQVGGAFPAVGGVDEQTGLDETSVCLAAAEVRRIGEGLDEGSAYGEFEGVVGAIYGVGAGGEIEKAVFLGVVREEGDVDVVGEETCVRGLGQGIGEEVVGAQVFFEKAVVEDIDRFVRVGQADCGNYSDETRCDGGSEVHKVDRSIFDEYFGYFSHTTMPV